MSSHHAFDSAWGEPRIRLVGISGSEHVIAGALIREEREKEAICTRKCNSLHPKKKLLWLLSFWVMISCIHVHENALVCECVAS